MDARHTSPLDTHRAIAAQFNALQAAYNEPQDAHVRLALAPNGDVTLSVGGASWEYEATCSSLDDCLAACLDAYAEDMAEVAA